MRVLYLNHTARVSGAERSLLELINALGAHVEPILACPEGELSRRAEAAGVRTVRLDPLQVGFGSGPREIVRAGGRLFRMAARVSSLSRRLEVDAIHAASARSGVVAAGAALMGAGRPVVDVRDALPEGPLATAVRWTLRLSAGALVFNSRFTCRQFGPTAPARSIVTYPPVDVERFSGLERDRALTPRELLTMGVIGQITPWKGQDDAIQILAQLRPRFPSLRLRIVGSVVFAGAGVTFDNKTFRSKLVSLASELGVADAVELEGATDDLESVFSSLDVLLVPSWEEPFGRVVAEAMAAGLAVVATSRGGPAELIEHGESGYLAEPCCPEAWIAPVSRLLADPELRGRVGDQARRRVVSALNRQQMLERMVRLYRTNQNPTSGLLLGSIPRGEAT
jgi:glycosyltransferase involved in cell wall biosynthesis